jgi:hypothetical protein
VSARGFLDAFRHRPDLRTVAYMALSNHAAQGGRIRNANGRCDEESDCVCGLDRRAEHSQRGR